MDISKARDWVCGIARKDLREGLKAASNLSEWYRCQALARISTYSKDRIEQLNILDESFNSARLCSSPNRIVTVGSWPVKVLFTLGYSETGVERAKELLSILQAEKSPVKRGDALDFLLGAVINAPRDLFWEIYEQLFLACTTRLESGKKNAKGHSILVSWAGAINNLDEQRADMLLSAIEGPTHAAQAHRAIEWARGRSVDTLISRPNI
ncbi:hypothetical protein [Vibrio parahaemolyticus]|uniref:hypothetical protein n=1 Tax=Vibrio parahaemolyticus TaxID=670 RepID=UPI0007A0A995|nr:hypothetical protein [Vibrio parahaemolyticus]KYX27586.1 hypothetical protein AVO50_01910 [Vibrio parahaemolyticus]